MARSFNGSTQFAEFAGGVATVPPLTMACWAFCTSLPTSNLVLMNLGANTGTNLFDLQVRGGVAGKPIAIQANSGSPSQAVSSLGPSANAWFHACGTVTSSTSRAAYFNGGNKGTDSTSVTNPVGINRTTLAALISGGSHSNFWAGLIAEAAVWNVVLSDPEIAALAAGVLPHRIRPASLVGYWPLWGLLSPEPDLSGNAATMTLTATPPAANHAPVSRFLPSPSIFLPLAPTASFTVTETSLPANHGAGTVNVHLVGTGTTWTSGTAFSVSGVAGWGLSSKTVVDATHYTLTLSCPAAATPPAGSTGTLTITDTTDSINATTSVATPTLTVNPTTADTGTTPTLTLSGGHTLWTTETAAGLFTLSGGTGSSIGTPTVSTDTSATAVLTAGTAAATETITDASTGATATVTVSVPVLTCGPTSSVADTTARISFRIDRNCSVQVKYSTNPTLAGGSTTASVNVTSTTDFTGKIDITGLTAGTTYSYTILLNGVDVLSATYPVFKTFPSAGQAASFSFAFGSCTAHTAANVPGGDTIWNQVPGTVSFALHLGDTVYADTDLPAASTLSDYRTKHQTAMAGGDIYSANWKAFRRLQPVFTIWDDHDIYDNFSAGTSDPKYAPAKQAFQEYHGRANPDPLTTGELYYTFQVGNVGFFVCDLRSFRSVETNTDNASKTILGSTQKTALKNWLLSNKTTYTLKFIIASVTASGYASNTGDDSWGGIDDGVQTPNGANGYRTERNEIWDYIDTNAIPGVVFLSGDMHWAASFKTTYGSVLGARPRYEFMSSPYNQLMLTPDTRAADPVNGPIFWKYGTAINFGLVTVNTTVSPATVSFQLYGNAGTLGSSFLTSLTTTDINSGLPSATAQIWPYLDTGLSGSFCDMGIGGL